MIFTLNILINICLIFAVFLLSKRRPAQIKSIVQVTRGDKKILGKLDRMYIRSVIAEKTADRAFNIASSANLGVVALQKALATPRLMTKAQSQRNGLAKKEVDALFSTGGTFDWLRPILSDEELEILDKVEEQKAKEGLNNN